VRSTEDPPFPRKRRALLSLRPALDAPENDKDNDDEQHKPEAAATIIAGAVERTATKAAEAAKQGNDQNDDENGSKAHGVLLSLFALSRELQQRFDARADRYELAKAFRVPPAEKRPFIAYSPKARARCAWIEDPRWLIGELKFVTPASTLDQDVGLNRGMMKCAGTGGTFSRAVSYQDGDIG
jgi:hypothetical protein